MTKLLLDFGDSKGEYELTETVGGAELGDLLTLKKSMGVSVRSIKLMFERMNDLYAAASQTAREILDEDPDAVKPGHPRHKELAAAIPDTFQFLDDEEFLRNIVGVIYLSRRKAGEDITPEDAARISWQAFSFDNNDDDEGSGGVDPKDDDPAHPAGDSK